MRGPRARSCFFFAQILIPAVQSDQPDQADPLGPTSPPIKGGHVVMSIWAKKKGTSPRAGYLSRCGLDRLQMQARVAF